MLSISTVWDRFCKSYVRVLCEISHLTLKPKNYIGKHLDKFQDLCKALDTNSRPYNQADSVTKHLKDICTLCKLNNGLIPFTWAEDSAIECFAHLLREVESSLPTTFEDTLVQLHSTGEETTLVSRETILTAAIKYSESVKPAASATTTTTTAAALSTPAQMSTPTKDITDPSPTLISIAPKPPPNKPSSPFSYQPPPTKSTHSTESPSPNPHYSTANNLHLPHSPTHLPSRGTSSEVQQQQQQQQSIQRPSTFLRSPSPFYEILSD